MSATLPPLTELIAPASWRRVDFISDLHLHASDEATYLAWQQYLEQSCADAVFILQFLFTSGQAPGAPFPACGVKPGGDGLGCGTSPACNR